MSAVISLRAAALRSGPRSRLTALAIWRGFVGIYNSNDLTFASSIAYYALLSLFPFFLLAFSILGSVTANVQRSHRDPRLRPALLSRASSSS